MPTVKSATSGNALPATVLKRSKMRAFFRLPSIKLAVLCTGLTGYRVSTSWYYPNDITGD